MSLLFRGSRLKKKRRALSTTCTLSVQTLEERRFLAIGVYEPFTATWLLRETTSSGPVDIPAFPYGGTNWKAVPGDWNGDGTDTVGSFDPEVAGWYQRNSNAAGTPDISPFTFGPIHSMPVVGDWNGDGIDTVGVFDPTNGFWYLRNSNSAGAPDVAPISFGAAGFYPIVGDWDNDGIDTIGVYDPASSQWYLRNSNTAGVSDLGPFPYGGPNWQPVVYDWNGDGKDTIGAYSDDAFWYLKNSSFSGNPDLPVFPFGQPSWTALTGTWSITSDNFLLLRDDFNGNALDNANWKLPEPDREPGAGNPTFLGRTQLRFEGEPNSTLPEVSGGKLWLALDTFNPAAPGASFFGTEIQTQEFFSRGDGLAFEARMRIVGANENPIPGGIVGGFFSFVTNFDVRDELDIELLTNDIVAGNERVLTNSFDSDDFFQEGDRRFVDVAGIDLTAFNTYRIQWLPDRVQWFVNGVLLREELETVPDGEDFSTDPNTAPPTPLPDESMQIRLNIWAASATNFPDAFSAGLQPVSIQGENESFFLEVDFVELSREILEPTSLLVSLTNDVVQSKTDRVTNDPSLLEALTVAENISGWLSGFDLALDDISTIAMLTTETGLGINIGKVRFERAGYPGNNAADEALSSHDFDSRRIDEFDPQVPFADQSIGETKQTPNSISIPETNSIARQRLRGDYVPIALDAPTDYYSDAAEFLEASIVEQLTRLS